MLLKKTSCVHHMFGTLFTDLHPVHRMSWLFELSPTSSGRPWENTRLYMYTQ